MKLVSAFVVDPDRPMGIPSRESEARRRQAFDLTSAATRKAVDTLVIQPVPEGSGELSATDGIEIGIGGVPIRGKGGRRAEGSAPRTR
jgi:hypothetical protein